MSSWQTPLLAQNDHSENIFLQTRQHELGINASSLVSAVLGDASNGLNTTQFPFSFKHILENRHAIRMGLELDLSNSSLRNQQSQTSVIRPRESGFGLRVGYEHRKHMGKRWVGYVGIDALTQWSRSSVTTESNFGNSTILTKTRSGGTGLAFGLQVALTQHIILGAESSLYLIYKENISENSFDNNPNQDSSSTNFQTDLQWTPPNSLYLSVRL